MFMVSVLKTKVPNRLWNAAGSHNLGYQIER
jgi:hypothetical protein